MKKSDVQSNPVEASIARPHFEGMTQNKGITLIALIITIIVMLILVGVTINVALNGGLFDKAQEAADKTMEATEKEQLMLAALAAFDVNTGVDSDKLDLPEGFKPVFEDDTKIVYEGPSGNQYEIIIETGNVNEVPKNEDDDNEEDDDTPPENITSTIWESRGVTSANVKFDTLYYVTLMDSEDFDTGMTFGLYSNGDMCIHMEKNTTSTTVSKEDGNGNNNTGRNGTTTDVFEQAYIGEVIKTFSNGFTMPFGEGGHDMTIRYTSENTVELYMATPDERAEEDGTIPVHVPEDEKYKVATLIPQ